MLRDMRRPGKILFWEQEKNTKHLEFIQREDDTPADDAPFLLVCHQLEKEN